MVIWFPFYNSTCTIERLGKDEAHHLMGEGHLGEGYLLVGTVVDGLGKTVWTADDKHQSASRSLFALYPFGKLDASELLPMLIHQDNGVGRLELLEYQLALTVLLLLFAEALGVLELRDGGDRERHVVGDALCVVLDASDEMLVDGLADQDKFCLHDSSFFILHSSLPRPDSILCRFFSDSSETNPSRIFPVAR